MPIDPSIPLGYKQPDQMQNLSSLLNVANGAQTLQQNQQRTQQGAIDLQQRQGMLDYLKSGDFIDSDGSVNTQRLYSNAARFGDTGMEIAKKAAETHQQGTAASQAWNNLGADKAAKIGNAVMALGPNAPPDVVHKTFDALDKQYKGDAGPITGFFRNLYDNAESHFGPDAGRRAVVAFAKSQMAPKDQQTFDTPQGTPVSDNQTSAVVSQAPDTTVPVGQTLPGTAVQMQLAPSTPTVGANNQPGYIGPRGGAFVPGQQPAPAAPQGAAPSAHAAFNREAQSVVPNNNMGPDTLRLMQQELAAEQAKGPNANPEAIAGLQREIQRAQQAVGGQGGFVPSGPVPGANESKAATVQMMNDHYTGLNKQAENGQLIEGLLGNIKSLAPKAITGTEQGRKSYVTGLLNALHLGNQATGDLQKDTDLLEKNIAQLGLNTPSSTDAMRTIVGAARPHGTMQSGAIEEAADQLLGQVRANRVIRNALTPLKSMADKTGDTTSYQALKEHMEDIADPRAWQFQAMDKPGRIKMMQGLSADDREKLKAKIRELESTGMLK